MYDQIKELNQRIARYKSYFRAPINVSSEEISIDNSWGASYLYASMMYNCSLGNENVLFRSSLDILKRRYEEETKTSVPLEDLLNKDWIRVVFNIIALPRSVTSALHRLHEYISSQNEIEFLKTVKDKNGSRYSVDELYGLAEVYNEGKATKVDLGKVKGLLWSESKDLVKIYDLKYPSFVLANQISLGFIERIYKLMHESPLVIGATVFGELYAKHSALFNKTPSVEKLVEDQVLILIEPDLYRFNLQSAGHNFHELIHDKSAALLWDMLLEDQSFKDDQERLNFWYIRAVHHKEYVQVQRYFTKSAKERFLEAASQAVLNETDLEDAPEDLYKVRLDKNHSSAGELLEVDPLGQIEKFPKTTDLYYLYEAILLLNREQGSDLMFNQRCRTPINFFLLEIVENDSEDTLALVIALLRASSTKPYLLYYLSFAIYYWRPEIIPNLIKSIEIAPLAFSLVLRWETDSLFPDRSEIKENVSVEVFQLICNHLAKEVVDEEKRVTAIFQCLLKTAWRKYRISGAASREVQNKELAEGASLYKRVGQIFAKTKTGAIVYGTDLKYEKSLFPEMIDGLVETVSTYRPYDTFQNGTISLPLVQLDLLSYLLKLATTKGPERIDSTIISKICDRVVSLYLTAINCKEVQKHDLFTNEMKAGIPSWRSSNLHNELLDWPGLSLYCEQEFLLNEFLHPPGLAFEGNIDVYDDYNRFVADKMRTHLSVLINAFNGIYGNQQSLSFKGLPVQSTLDKLESSITSIIVRYCTLDVSKKRLDIFDATFERGYLFSEKDELLPSIGNLLNRFKSENRERILGELVLTDKLMRSLTLLDYVVYEPEKRRLMKVISGENIHEKLADLSYAELQRIIDNSLKDAVLLDGIEAAIDRADTLSRNFEFQQDETSVFTFRSRLLLAFNKNDLAAIEGIPNPDVKYVHGHHFSAQDEKDFYTALFYLKNKRAEDAYRVFNKLLSYATQDRPTLALNRFASKLRWADQVEDVKSKMELVEEALSEWNEFEDKLQKKELLQEIQEKVLYNILFANDFLNKDSLFDQIYSTLDKPIQLRDDFLQLRIQSFIRRKMQIQAEEVLYEAKRLHQLADGSYPDYIYELEKSISSEDVVVRLRETYNRIFRSSPEDLVKIIPSNVNDGELLSRFLLNEILCSANDVLTYINSLSKVDHEDKYTDLLLLALNGRLINYQWHANTSRGGFSESSEGEKADGTEASLDDDVTNLGEIDFKIYAANKEQLAVGEALIVIGRDTGSVQSHVLKIFNYDHARKLFFMIVYYKGKTEAFQHAWEAYCDVVETFVEFPKGYELSNEKLEPVSDISSNPSIKVAKGLHEQGVEVFHVFINISYRVKTRKKSVRKTKG